MMISLTNKSVLVLGLGETGLSLVRWLAAQNARIQVADSRTLPPAMEELRQKFPQVEIHCGAFRDELFNHADMIAIAPAYHCASPV